MVRCRAGSTAYALCQSSLYQPRMHAISDGWLFGIFELVNHDQRLYCFLLLWCSRVYRTNYDDYLLKTTILFFTVVLGQAAGALTII